jgi:hypothetical protein
MSQQSYPLSFYKSYNILSFHNSIQFFAISNSRTQYTKYFFVQRLLKMSKQCSKLAEAVNS